ncbi:glycosyltransferase family 4 protein [Sphingorhabdus sp. 109]|jgi:glycosyltransferase involved in cell wall biosynthesis|uniref:glycosyltransferase family 4 protein n=1 Tax=Sphingorhabdus sp. 109 TaxID=2653173 RepID=UPI0012F0CCE7|nr:glycosyltransferase family 4 protein [Sphingorhabdus sp. 109]VWX58411.1 conserved hypothetical protein [Sphingorhabdus sp. 109]
MTSLPKIVHLLDDLSIGGVTRNLALFQHPALQRHYECSSEEVHPDWSIAPKMNAAVIVVHFSMSWKTLPFLYSLAARNAQARLVLVEHSYSREWENLYVADQTRFRSMLKLAHRMFDRVICVSDAQAGWLEESTGLRAPKRQTIYPWSDMQGLAQLPRPHFSLKAPLIIGAYGRFVEDKGFERLIGAINALGDQQAVGLLLGGFGPDEDKLRRLAGSNSNISFYGQIDRVDDFLAKCDLVAVPSKFETYGLVATEARMAARPILVSGVGGLSEQVGEAGMVTDFGDEKATVKLLENIRHLPLVKMSVSGRDACLDITEHRIESWLQLLGDIASSRTMPRAA